jgi:hypothetical protein
VKTYSVYRKYNDTFIGHFVAGSVEGAKKSAAFKFDIDISLLDAYLYGVDY